MRDMGFGDEIMASGLAHLKAKEVGGPVAILDKQGRARWSMVWENNPEIATPAQYEANEEKGEVTCGSNARPYIERWDNWGGKPQCVFTRWQARSCPGRIYLKPEEISFGQQLEDRVGPFVIVEPRLVNSNPNKEWGFDKYQELVKKCGDLRWVQMGHVKPRMLDGAEWVGTASYRDACAVLRVARAAVLPEGGLHHAAGVLGTPAVVIFGGHTHPDTTGYNGHVNLYSDSPEGPCGRYAPCPHCREAMARISVDEVETALRGLLGARK